VGATQYDKTLAYYSNYGTNLDIVAPGGNTSVDQNGDGYGDGILQQTFSYPKFCSFGYYFYSGTSMATPHVAGTAALLLAKGNATTPDQIKTAIESTALDLGTSGRDDIYGYGLLDAAAALNWSTAPECDSNDDCDNGLYCDGIETCVSGVCTAGAAVDCSGSLLNDLCNTAVCSESEEGRCAAKAKSDGTICGGTYCGGLSKCQSGACIAGSAPDCGDNNDCTQDACNESSQSCTHVSLVDGLSCNGGMCCSGACRANVSTCSTVCWNGTNQYLYPLAAQAKKFCKCAQGNYAYKNYKTTIGRKTVFSYTSSLNDENWTTVSKSGISFLSSVTCGDGKIYYTNQNYSYPKY
jgi:hypothetical protein